jgi:3-hydroxyisobutyrate dehydrogenase-like beta-hydroxyacid dehydrogenase
MAANLVKAGHEVAVWNRTPGKVVEGARAAQTPADAANGAEVIWMCVSDTKAVETVLFGPQGVESTIASGAIVVDSSTISPTAERQFADRLRAKGVDYVDAPVTGSKVAAEAGSLPKSIRCSRQWENKSFAWAKQAKARPPSWL